MQIVAIVIVLVLLIIAIANIFYVFGMILAGAVCYCVYLANRERLVVFLKVMINWILPKPTSLDVMV